MHAEDDRNESPDMSGQDNAGAVKDDNSNGSMIHMTLTQTLPWSGLRAGWDPILGLETIKNTMSELMADLFYQPGKAPFELPWQPPIDMYMQDDYLYIEIPLAGCSKELIQIHSTSDILIVQGEIPKNPELKSENYFTRERKTGMFSRSVPLPFEVVPEGTKAHFREGLLCIIIPVKTDKRQASIKIEIE
ncbi:MAG: Hsp20/alpha crystallin family protein [Firmicutes bacterium]|nr:Hsp20/alpha crystallin family protein [Bacillota bacterium]